MSDSGTKKSQGEQDPEKPVKRKKKMSKKKKLATALLILLALLVIIAGAVYAVGHHYYSKTNYMTDEEVAEQLKQNGLEILETHSADGWYAYLCR